MGERVIGERFQVAEVSLANVSKHYGAQQVLYDISLDIADGEFAVIVGPSGCGKSTLLRSIAGLEQISAGTISIEGKDVTEAAPSDRNVAMVFQSYALYPHMTVRENMDFGMKVNKFDPEERQRRITETSRILQLEPYLDRRPSQLSGGQRQRVAIGRAIVKQPKVFLFDEPLSNLDAKLRIQMRVELETLHNDLNATMIYVTHDQVEAMTMADKIVVLNNGRIEQVGTPMDLYHRPTSEFVAGFIGAPSMNFIDIEMRDGMIGCGDADLAAPGSADEAFRLGVRPEHIEVHEPGAGDMDALVKVRELLGGESYLHTHTKTGAQLVVRADGETPVKAGDTVGLRLPAHRMHLFASDGRTLISGSLSK